MYSINKILNSLELDLTGLFFLINGRFNGFLNPNIRHFYTIPPHKEKAIWNLHYKAKLWGVPFAAFLRWLWIAKLGWDIEALQVMLDLALQEEWIILDFEKKFQPKYWRPAARKGVQEWDRKNIPEELECDPYLEYNVYVFSGTLELYLFDCTGRFLRQDSVEVVEGGASIEELIENFWEDYYE